MQAVVSFRMYFLAAAGAAALLCQTAGAQGRRQAPPPEPEKIPDASEIPRLHARSSPADYGSRAQVGAYTVAAEYKEHSIPTPTLTMVTGDYIVFEVGLFGPAGSRLTISAADFTLKINGKKALPAQNFVTMFKSIKDPNYVTPGEEADKKSKESEGDDNAPAGTGPSDRNPQWHPVPFPVQRSWEQRLAKASLPEGDRALPEGGLIYFRYNGRPSGVFSLELLYAGAAGKASIEIEP